MNLKSMILSVRSLRSSWSGAYVALLLSVLVTSHLTAYDMRSRVNGISQTLTEHLPTTPSVTRSALTLDCFLRSGVVSLNQNPGRGESFQERRVVLYCRSVENPDGSGELIPVPKSYFDLDNSAISPKSSAEPETHSTSSNERSDSLPSLEQHSPPSPISDTSARGGPPTAKKNDSSESHSQE